MRQRAPINFLASIRSCFVLLWRSSPLYTLLRLFGKCIVPLISIALSIVTKYVLDRLAAQSPDGMKVFLWLTVLLLLISIAATLINKVTSYAESMQNEMLQRHIQMDLMEKAMSADLEMFDNPRKNDRFASVSNDSFALTYIVWNAVDLAGGCVGLASSFLILCSSNPLYGILVGLTAVPSALVTRAYTKILYRFNLSQTNQERQKNYLFGLATSGLYAPNVRFYHLGAMLKARYLAIWKGVFDRKRGMIRRRMVVTTILQLLPDILVTFIMFDIGRRVFLRQYTIGDYSLYTGLLSQLIGAIFLCVEYGGQIVENRLKLENVSSFEKIPRSITDGELHIRQIDAVEFRQVGFTYPGTGRQILKDVSFTLQQGERVALVGLNGAGKSTIIKLLLRFYDVTEGEIRINGRNIRSYRLEDLRGCFSVYLQNDVIFGFSLRENVELNRADGSLADALELSGADALLQNAPKGMETSITRQFDELGMELSEGQKQKLALARAFYRNCSIVILDEPSSSLDPEAEDQVLRSLEQFSQGKLALFTSHRLTNVSIADRIIVLEDGRIVEEGTREELLRQSGRFAELYTYQAEKFR